jgi:gp16 family phage-associated protein
MPAIEELCIDMLGGVYTILILFTIRDNIEKHTFTSYDAVNDKLLDTTGPKKLFEASGISVAEWAREKGFSTGLVYQVLEGNRKCLRGQSHRIALALGLKQGLAMDMSELLRKLEETMSTAVKEDVADRLTKK